MSNQIDDLIQEHFHKHDFIQANVEFETVEEKNAIKCRLCGEVICRID